jgi:hypothetical protein
MAIWSVATRLPFGISSPEQLWDFLGNKGEKCARIPAGQYATNGLLAIFMPTESGGNELHRFCHL